MLSRREWLASAAIGLGGYATRRAVAARPRLPRVVVAPDRVIRVIVGLRPFRPSGFVVRAEKLGEKLLIHNYGHGGAGITLSWGTAQLALDLAQQSELRNCAVIGCGVAGLTTARLLQLRGYNPVIYTKDMPPATTSNVAGGLWEPVTVYDHERVTPEFRKQFADASRFAFRRYQSLAGPEYGVRWLPLYTLSQDNAINSPPPESPLSEVDPLYPEKQFLDASTNPFHVRYGQRRQSMLIEPATYLNALVRDFLIGGGRVVVREMASPREVAALNESLIFNCTGLGARDLFGDPELTPVRGQLVFLLPQPEIDYMTVGPGNIYMFPRKDGILLGGSRERGSFDLEPDAGTTERILRENSALFSGV